MYFFLAIDVGAHLNGSWASTNTEGNENSMGKIQKLFQGEQGG
jgi:hypothetical protein